ncbi:MAG: hypothetical protein E7258_05720 [Lachnospiraceae bacterium]|nr:hypothetical protein [Lachnospiraceae bacterium]
MKKVNSNLLFVVIICVILMIPMLLFATLDSKTSGDSKESVFDMLEDAKEDGEVDDVEGWGIIFVGFSSFVGVFFLITVLAFSVFLTIYAGIMIILALIARAIYKSEGPRLTLYRVIMSIVHLMLAILAVLIFVSLFSNFYIPLGLIGVVYTVFLVLSIRNTYSSRILY